MFRKVLVANRGEIAVRAFRAATELGARTVAVFPYEDRKSEHRLKADEAYQIGEEGHPVRAYLDHEAIVAPGRRGRRRRDLPGLRLPLGEPAPRRGVRRRRHHLHRPAGRRCCTSPATRPAPSPPPATPGCRRCAAPSPAPTSTPSEAAAEEIGFPVFVKAVSGGGGRGMRRVETPRGPARRARGRPARGRVRVRRPDALPRGGRGQPAAHRGPGARRQHRRGRPPLRARLLAAAPPPEGRRDRAGAQPRRRRPASSMCADAVAFARSIGYVNAGTVEFLLGEDGRYVFIEMNPRIQVEHTVTEEVTDIDLVVMQMQIASGDTFAVDGPAPGRHPHQGLRACSAASRRRTPPTASARRRHASPSTARPAAAACASTAAPSSSAPRSAPTSTRCSSSSPAAAMTFPIAVRRAQRALAEFRIRGVSTNIPFLEAVLADPVFQAGPRDDVVHRRAARAARRAGQRRPGDEAAHLPRRRHRQPAQRPGHDAGPPAHQAARLPRRAAAGRRPRPARRRRAGRLRARAARGERRRRHRHDLPRRPPVAARDPDAHPRPAPRRRARLPR